MHPFYFGKSEQPLYGVIHNPSGGDYRNSAILLCNSVGYESICCHRALRRLATLLSESGYYVLRFDYSGVGDSSGTFEEKSMSDWEENIQLAKEELCAISGLQLIDCIGVRLGATLAYNALNDSVVKNLILWDPILNGHEYLNSLNNLQDEVMISPMWFRLPRDRDTIPKNEFLGYRYSPALINQFSKEKIIVDSQPHASKLVHIYTIDNAANQQFTSDLNNIEYASEFITDTDEWDTLNSIDSSFTANQIINRIAQEFK